MDQTGRCESPDQWTKQGATSTMLEESVQFALMLWTVRVGAGDVVGW
jgi:hypothetical protein